MSDADAATVIAGVTDLVSGAQRRALSARVRVEIQSVSARSGTERPASSFTKRVPLTTDSTCAIDLARLAAEAGADAVKFQILDPDRLVADRKQPSRTTSSRSRDPRAPRRYPSPFTTFSAGAACRMRSGAS